MDITTIYLILCLCLMATLLFAAHQYTILRNALNVIWDLHSRVYLIPKNPEKLLNQSNKEWYESMMEEQKLLTNLLTKTNEQILQYIKEYEPNPDNPFDQSLNKVMLQQQEEFTDALIKLQKLNEQTNINQTLKIHP